MNKTAERRRPSSAKTKEPIVVIGDLLVPPTIMHWERELLLLVVVPLVADMIAAAEKTEAGGRPSP